VEDCIKSLIALIEKSFSISLSTEPLFSLSLPLQQCHSKGQPFNLHLFGCSLIKSEPRKKQKEKEKIKTHLVYVQLFHIRAKEMKEMRVSESRTRACRKISMLGFGVHPSFIL